LSPRMEAILSVDTTKGNRIITIANIKKNHKKCL
jgi:hypothetical protein